MPARTARPPITEALKSFKQAISEINDFYWGARAGFDSLRRLRPPTAVLPADFLEPAIAAHLNVNLTEFDRRLDEQPRRLHYLCLVDAVTFYEEFLLKTLVRELPSRKVFKPNKPTEKQAKNIINGSYEKRPEDIDDALELDICSFGSEHDLDIEDLKSAFLARNCIVHAGGTVSDRELPRLSLLVPGLKESDRLPVDEPLWRRFLGALLNHAEDLDLLTRLNYRKP
ncbi:hypothetical protein [Myxococcus vastator]|uniref:hypothetical protein n=1 Tax=Myxococcus vastator TaxID=2709664 RepID=UPI0013D77E96|nr:hypothetical protein [Myxococcus vastator]